MCLMIKRVIYAKNELHEVPIEYQDMYKYMDEASEPEKKAILARRTGNSARGGSSWPTTTAHSL